MFPHPEIPARKSESVEIAAGRAIHGRPDPVSASCADVGEKFLSGSRTRQSVDFRKVAPNSAEKGQDHILKFITVKRKMAAAVIINLIDKLTTSYFKWSCLTSF